MESPNCVKALQRLPDLLPGSDAGLETAPLQSKDKFSVTRSSPFFRVFDVPLKKRLAVIVGRLADTGFSAHLSHRRPLFQVSQIKRDLLLAEPRFL
jgi:hypothetical protein